MKNRVTLVGNVGNDPEVKQINNSKVANLSVATNDFYYNDKKERVEQTEWHRVVAWGKTAEIIEKFVGKGKEIMIEGKLATRSWDDKDGKKNYITEIVANNVLLLGNTSH